MIRITDKNAQEYIQDIGDWTRGHVEKLNSNGVVIGMSGGMDCSVVARICQLAGIDVHLVTMPDGDTMGTHFEDAMQFSQQFGIPLQVVDIKEPCDAVEHQIGIPLGALERSNIRPRIRMTVLYALAQEMGRFVIGTSNLDERLLGYFTKHGDGASDFNPLGDITKEEIRILARHLDLPERIITKPPSAGLEEGQTDEGDFGFTYKQSNDYIREGTSGNDQVNKMIEQRIARNGHKLALATIYKGLNRLENYAKVEYGKN
ncbi:MAG: NAD(+) synthase [Firmicutes bacterium]|nr:NAD(+) synthase [Bacillota bacterium]